MATDDEEATYSAGFYEDLGALAHHAALELVPTLLELIDPKSVVDVGCGAGAFVREFARHGVKDVLGIEGPDFPSDLYRGPDETLVVLDLEQPVELDRRFDLVVCLEVAEHLSYPRSAGFVRDLVRLGDVVVFSAAIPGQGGTHHVNEQWPTFWREQFARHGFEAHDVLRPRVWTNPSVATWYKQNLVMYAESGGRLAPAVEAAAPFSIVHPDQYALAQRQLAAIPTLEHQVRVLTHDCNLATHGRDIVTDERDALEHERDEAGARARALEGELFRAHLALEENVAELERLVAERDHLVERAAENAALLAAAQTMATARVTADAGPRLVPAPIEEPAAAPPHRRSARLSSIARLLLRRRRPPEPPARPSVIELEPFDAAWYRAENPDVSGDPRLHYAEVGWREGRRPHPLFDSDWYVATNPHVATSDADPLRHYATAGWRERRDPHPLFDTAWYLTTYPDVAASGMNPLAHFDRYGWREGRNPHRLFNTTWYLARNPDVADTGMNPLSHFVLYGVYEGRPPAPARTD